MPIANGHMGAMCYGGVGGKFDISENTCWSGENQENPLQENAKISMEKVRNLLLEEEFEKANELLEFCTGVKNNYGTQIPMGRLFASVDAKAQEIYRELELMDGITTDKLTFETGKVFRESFVSNKDRVMGVKMTAKADVMPSLCLWLEGYSQPSYTKWDKKNNTLTVSGRALENIHSDGLTGVSYIMKLCYETDGTADLYRHGLVIENASYLTIFMAAATDMFDNEPLETCTKYLSSACKKGWESLKMSMLLTIPQV